MAVLACNSNFDYHSCTMKKNPTKMRKQQSKAIKCCKFHCEQHQAKAKHFFHHAIPTNYTTLSETKWQLIQKHQNMHTWIKLNGISSRLNGCLSMDKQILYAQIHGIMLETTVNKIHTHNVSPKRYLQRESQKGEEKSMWKKDIVTYSPI